MTFLLEFKEQIKSFYTKYERYITPGLKFLVALITFFMISQNIGFMTKLKNPIIVILLAVVCAFVPRNITVLIAALLVLAHLYAASMEMALLTLVVFIILFLLYFRFAPKYSFVVLLTPLAFACKIPYLMPLIVGLIATPVAAVPVSAGVVVYYILQYGKQYASALTNGNDSIVQTFSYIVEQTVANPVMLLTMVSFVITIFIVYFIRRMSVEHAWNIAIAAGALADVLILLIGDFMLDVPNEVVWLLVGTVISVVIVWILQFFLFNVDYSRTEYVQFEDDEYYYYVKAIPKVTIATPEKTVKRINPQKKVRTVQQKKQMEEE